ncbi:MAG: hypothetical protein HY865_22305 [Chloroflexi bacterium]|nr:hypothetical protein [Chloroflexota bacterium]
MTDLQKTVLEVANYAKKNNLDPIGLLQEYFDEKDSHFPRARIEVILKNARQAQFEELQAAACKA